MTAPSQTIGPPKAPGPLLWIRKNLFNSWFNAILTILILVGGYFFLSGVIRWVFTSADWRPVINFPILYMVGQYPRDQLWRIGLSTALVSFMFGLSWGVWGNLIRSFAISIAAFFGIFALLPVENEILTTVNRTLLFMNVLLVFVGYFLRGIRSIKGWHVGAAWVVVALLASLIILPGFAGSSLLPQIATTSWGGLLVTLFLAAGGIILSFPIGVLLALGRRSTLPVVKAFCVTFIESIRGVPLITILFMFSVIIQLFLPEEARIDRLVRALIGMTVFSAAYTAENVRGGLAAVPEGQVEAAKAVGMNNFQITALIVLPQAIRAVIPAIVGQFISLFKDTTLAIIIGINELLGIGKSIINTDPAFIRLQAEVYIFIAALFWIISYILSYASRQLEATLGVGER